MAAEMETRLDQGVATITLNRPEVRNALSVYILDSLPDLLLELRDNKAVRCIVITGAGEEAFSAGGDIKALSSDFGTPDEMVEKIVTWSRTPMLLHQMPKPTLAAVNGVAAGAGMALALACDLRIASTKARFVTAFAKLGISGDFGGSYFLTHLVGTGKARELYFLSDRVEANEALSLGLVNWLVEPEALVFRTRAIASRLASIPSVTIGAIKRNLNAAYASELSAIIRMEAEAQLECGMNADTFGAIESFLNRRRE